MWVVRPLPSPDVQVNSELDHPLRSCDAPLGEWGGFRRGEGSLPRYGVLVTLPGPGRALTALSQTSLTSSLLQRPPRLLRRRYSHQLTRMAIISWPLRVLHHPSLPVICPRRLRPGPTTRLDGPVENRRELFEADPRRAAEARPDGPIPPALGSDRRYHLNLENPAASITSSDIRMIRR